MITEPKAICVDFDQTLCDSTYPDVGPPKEGAKEAMQALRDMGYTIIISSCRSCSWNWDVYYSGTKFCHASERPVFQAMVRWLDENEIPYDIIDTGDKGKVSAHYYLDDKGLRFENNWPEIVEFIRQRDNATSHR